MKTLFDSSITYKTLRMNNKKEEKKPKKQNVSGHKKELEGIQKERDEYLKGWQRAKADFINYKQEEGERIGRAREIAEEGVIVDMIRILDSFDLGLASMKKDTPERKGVEMIKSQFEDALKKYGVEKMEEKIGEEFDPTREECIEQVDSPSARAGGSGKEYKTGQVVEQVESGYTYKEKVIRPARVKVAK